MPDSLADRHVCLITSSLLARVNFIATIIQLRAPGMTWMRMPSFAGAICDSVSAVAGFPPLEAAGVMQLMDKVAHTSFFLPTGLSVGGALANVSAAAARCCGNISSGSWSSGSLRADSAGDGHRCRDYRQQHAQPIWVTNRSFIRR